MFEIETRVQPHTRVDSAYPIERIADRPELGLISIGDLVKDIISEQRYIIDQLEHYIRGER